VIVIVAVTVDSDRLDTVTGEVAVIVVVTVWSTLIFQGGRMGQGKGVVASFQLVPESGSWSFLQKNILELPSGWSLRIRGCSLLLVGAREFREL
jgi:hypothetical protein